LTDQDARYLRGERGTGAALAMRVVLAVAASMGASRLVDIESAHVDGCLYVGSVSIDFARALVDGGARVSVPTTLNVGSVDLLHPRNWNGTGELADNARTLMSLYTALGCKPTWTCAPYLLTPRPRFGAHIAWGESNAIAFANSVLGARTQRYGDFVDIAAAVVGRAPFAGLHTDEGRLGEVLIDVTGLPADAVRRDSFFPLLGHLVGQWCGSRIPVVSGLSSATEDQLKAFGAAAASAGASLSTVLVLNRPGTVLARPAREPRPVVLDQQPGRHPRLRAMIINYSASTENGPSPPSITKRVRIGTMPPRPIAVTALWRSSCCQTTLPIACGSASSISRPSWLMSS